MSEKDQEEKIYLSIVIPVLDEEESLPHLCEKIHRVLEKQDFAAEVLFIDDGSQMIGSMMIMEYPDHAACDEFWAGEPLNYGGVFSHVAIERWRYGKSLG